MDKDDEPSVLSAAGLFDVLDGLSATERRDAILQWLAGNQEETLDLSIRGGRRARLDGLELGRDALLALAEIDDRAPVGFQETGGALNLRGARLEGANLRQTNLAGANLPEASLTGALLGRVCLREAVLEQADLRDADLAQADLQRAQLGEANASGALLEDADLRGAVARHAVFSGAVLDGALLEGADLWGAIAEGADFTNADIRGVRLEGANLAGANFSGAILRGANLRRANLSGANLRGADLQDAILTGSNLSCADLSGAALQGVPLINCNLRHIRLSGAWLDRTSMKRSQLDGCVGEEVERDYEHARESYLALEQNFRSLGDPDAASWAYRRNRRMQKLEELGRLQSALHRRSFGEAHRPLFSYVTDQAAEWLCDYGESMSRVMVSLVATSIAFAILYDATDCLVLQVEGAAGAALHEPSLNDLLIYSALAMTTSGPPDIYLEARTGLAYVLSGTQGFIGLVLLGLLGFVLGNRIRR